MVTQIKKDFEKLWSTISKEEKERNANLRRKYKAVTQKIMGLWLYEDSDDQGQKEYLKLVGART